jgi:nitroreductase
MLRIRHVSPTAALTADPQYLLDTLRARRSIGPRGLVDPAPPPEVLQQAAELALRAPDHQALRPVRFVHVGREERTALGELFARVAIDQGRDAEGVAIARERALAGPALLAVVARIRDDVPDVPPHEQWLTVGAAVMNLLHALHLQGYGAKVLGGSAARSEMVRRAFCHAGEQLACWVITGTADGDARPQAPERPPRDLLTDWTPPGA